jgi:hypothetical protein
LFEPDRIEALAIRTGRLIEVRFDPRAHADVAWRARYHAPDGSILNLADDSLAHLIDRMEAAADAHPAEPD